MNVYSVISVLATKGLYLLFAELGKDVISLQSDTFIMTARLLKLHNCPVPKGGIMELREEIARKMYCLEFDIDEKFWDSLDQSWKLKWLDRADKVLALINGQDTGIEVVRFESNYITRTSGDVEYPIPLSALSKIVKEMVHTLNELRSRDDCNHIQGMLIARALTWEGGRLRIKP